MHLVRLVVVDLGSLAPGWEGWTTRRDDVETVTGQALKRGGTSEGRALVLQARVPLSALPPLDEKARVVVPDAERRRCEAALEEVADVLGVVSRCRRTLRSPRPCVALLPDGDGEREYLETSTGLSSGLRTVRSAMCSVPFADFEIEWLADRRLGVALLSNAMAAQGPVGRYRDLVRLFENGFRLQASRLGGPLATFLNHGERGFTKAEVEEWMKPRNPLSHGNEQEWFPHEAEVRALLPRMEEAALDVLFNKAMWRDRSATRRDAWRSPVWTMARDCNKLGGIVGREWGVREQILDPYGRYPIDLTAEIAEWPAGWWAKQAESRPDDSPAAEPDGRERAYGEERLSFRMHAADPGLSTGKG